jgi:hypothetical protein
VDYSTSYSEVVRFGLVIAAAFLAGCAAPPPPPPVAQAAKSDPVSEEWYGRAVRELASINRDAAKSLAAGKTDAAATLVTRGQDVEKRLLAATKPSLAAMEAAGDLDDLYGRILMANHNTGWARIVFQKNVARWTNWRPVTPETEERRKKAVARIAECDRALAGGG